MMKTEETVIDLTDDSEEKAPIRRHSTKQTALRRAQRQASDEPEVAYKVQLPTGKRIDVDVASSASILALKEKIRLATEIPEDKMRLITAGRELKPDTKLLSQCATQPHQLIQVFSSYKPPQTTSPSAQSIQPSAASASASRKAVIDIAAMEGSNNSATMASLAQPQRGRKRKAPAPEAAPAAAQSSSSTADQRQLPSTSGAKRKRAPKEKAEPVEKRLKKYLPSASQKVRERIARAITQRLFLISRRKLSDDQPGYSFSVLGSTGNVYEVAISSLVSCTCPDFLKGNLCKHILFVMLKVLRLDSSSPLVWQRALLKTELESIFASAPDPTGRVDIMANSLVREQYSRIEAGSGVARDCKMDQRPIGDDDDCPICFDPLKSYGGEGLVYCQYGCGQSVHRKCWDNWRKQQTRSGGEVSCIYCRAAWEPRRALPGDPDSAYVNMGVLQGQPTEREPYQQPYRRRRNYRSSWSRDYDDDFDEGDDEDWAY